MATRSRHENGSLNRGYPYAEKPVRTKRAKATVNVRVRRRQILWFFGIVFAGLLFAMLTASPVFAVRKIVFNGLNKLTPEEASSTRSSIFVPKGINLFRCKTGMMEKSLKQLPWVASARVSRALPNRIVIKITPREPVAVISSPAGKWELDAGAVPFRKLDMEAKLPLVECNYDPKLQTGCAIADPATLGAMQIVTSLKCGDPLPLAKISIDQNFDICLNMQDSIEVRLGQADGLLDKLTLVRTIYREDPGISSKVSSIDLRCPSAAACVPRHPLPGMARDNAAQSPQTHGVNPAEASHNRRSDETAKTDKRQYR